MSEIRVNNLSNESDSGGPTISGITTFSSPYFFVPPVGTTDERPENPEPGALRFNTDSKHLEYFRGDIINWVEVEASNEELNGGYRGLIMGGGGSPYTNTIQYLTISTLSNTIDFGDLVLARASLSSFASSTRAVAAGGYAPGNRREMDYVTISSTGNAADFGDLLNDNHQYAPSGTSNQTRGLVAGGLKLPSPYTSINRIQYNTIATTGDSVDFGDMTADRSDLGSCNSSTRSVFMGGSQVPTSPGGIDTMDYVTTASLGNASDFGNLAAACVPNDTGCSNSVRGLVHGSRSPSQNNTIQYITIASTGDATDFGDMLNFSGGYNFSCAAPTRGIICGGAIAEYVEIMTTGNATDFGDITPASYGTMCCNGHGGL